MLLYLRLFGRRVLRRLQSCTLVNASEERDFELVIKTLERLVLQIATVANPMLVSALNVKVTDSSMRFGEQLLETAAVRV
jgi:hypothetical protein